VIAYVSRSLSSALRGAPLFRCPIWPRGRNGSFLVMDLRGVLFVVPGRGALRRLRP
jgi:hypothetical protein